MPARNETAFAENSELKILRRQQVEALVGKSCSSIYSDVAAGTFPKQIKIGAQSVGWLESEIINWIRERIAASRPSEAIGAVQTSAQRKAAGQL
jgi:prophage regulatory protein